ncbi:MAG: hypothetical protein H7Z42_01495 [Roseiflexaceae bacterium]|nr:hypothetical protein [Roseiflexaceae bacterium]
MAKHDLLPFTHFLHDVDAQLGTLTPEQRERVLQELRQHLLDAAQQAGVDPNNPMFQATVIQRLGASRELGRALARVYRTPFVTKHSLTYLVGGCAAASSALVLAAALPSGFLLHNGQLTMNMMTGAPVALFPTMMVLHHIYAPLRPWRSMLALVCGLLGVLTLFFWTVWHDIIVLFGVHDTALHLPLDVLNTYQFVSGPLLGLLGVWLLLIGHLSRITRIPAAPQFGWMSTITGVPFLLFIVWGLIYGGFITMMGGVPPLVEAIIAPLWGVTVLFWFVCYLGWTVGTAMWLLQRRLYPPLKAT